MTRDVVTVRTDTPLKQAAALLTQRRISGLPVLGDDRHVLGVLSEGDIIFKEQGTRERPGLFERLLAGPPKQLDLKLSARTVGQAMTAPALTISARRPVTEAASTMIEEGVNRLPVVDHDDRLIGIITRADLVRAFVRSDAEVEHEIREEVLLRTLWLDPGVVEVEVDGGEVKLTGEVETRGDAEAVPALVERVPGVVAVQSDLRWRTDTSSTGRCPDRPEQRRRPPVYSCSRPCSSA
jgi:CBS domain-containing protein